MYFVFSLLRYTLLPINEMPPIEVVTPDHSTAELVSGRVLPYPVGLPVVHGDGLDCTAVKNSVTREDYC